MGHDLDDQFGETVVAEIVIQLRRNGAMSVAGNINDEAFGIYLIDTAKDTLRNYHARLRLGQVGGLIVPAYDTALTGTPEERQLAESWNELHKARDAKEKGELQ
jgi:hypothetical protein